MLMIEVAATTSLPQTSAHTQAPTHTNTHTHLQGLLLLPVAACMCSPLAWSLCLSPSRHVTAPLPSLFLSPPFLSPCNLTLSTLVSCLLANTDCSRPGTRFSCLNLPSSLLYLLRVSQHPLLIHSLTPSLTHSHVFLLPHALLFLVWFLRTCMFLENTPPSCSFCCLFSNLRPFSSFQPQIDFFSCSCFLLLSLWQALAAESLHITLISEKNRH